MKFGLICEGVTDFHVLKHVIQSYFSEAQIHDIQPELDARQMGTAGDEFGGWEQVANYLQTDQFEVTVANTDYVVIQIDTDVCEEINFGVSPISLADSDHDAFYELIRQKLIEWINSSRMPLNKRKKKRYEFYLKLRKISNFAYYQEQIIFAISVHSLECWLLAYHGSKGSKIVGCIDELCRTINKQGGSFNIKDKDYREYIEYSKDFKKQKNHKTIVAKSESFKRFVEQLDAIKIEPEAC